MVDVDHMARPGSRSQGRSAPSPSAPPIGGCRLLPAAGAGRIARNQLAQGPRPTSSRVRGPSWDGSRLAPAWPVGPWPYVARARRLGSLPTRGRPRSARSYSSIATQPGCLPASAQGTGPIPARDPGGGFCRTGPLDGAGPTTRGGPLRRGRPSSIATRSQPPWTLGWAGLT